MTDRCPPAQGYTRGRLGAGSTRDASHFEQGFLISKSSLCERFLAVHLKGFPESGAQVLQKLGARLALGVYAWDLLNPANPPSVIFAKDGIVGLQFHTTIVRRRGCCVNPNAACQKSRKTKRLLRRWSFRDAPSASLFRCF